MSLDHAMMKCSGRECPELVYAPLEQRVVSRVYPMAAGSNGIPWPRSSCTQRFVSRLN